MARELQTDNPQSMHVLAFANHSGDQALHAVLDYVDTDHNGILSDAEKSTARIVLYGHSWGASQTITLARQLNAPKHSRAADRAGR